MDNTVREHKKLIVERCGLKSYWNITKKVKWQSDMLHIAISLLVLKMLALGDQRGFHSTADL